MGGGGLTTGQETDNMIRAGTIEREPAVTGVVIG